MMRWSFLVMVQTHNVEALQAVFGTESVEVYDRKTNVSSLSFYLDSSLLTLPAR